MTLLLRMDDNMNRQLTCEFTLSETPKSLANELVTHGFINAVSHPCHVALVSTYCVS